MQACSDLWHHFVLFTSHTKYSENQTTTPPTSPISSSPSAAAAAAATTGLRPKNNLHKWTVEEEINTSIPLRTPQPSYLDAGLQLHFCQCPWHQTEPPSPTTLASPRTVHMLALQSNPAPCINIPWHQAAHQSGQLRIYIPCTKKTWVCRLYFTTFYNDSEVWGSTCFRNNATFTSFTSVVHVIRQKYDFCTWPQMLLVPLCCHSYSYNKKIDPPHETSQIHGNSTDIWPSPNNTEHHKTAQHNKTRLQNYYHGHFDHSGSRQQAPWCKYLCMFKSKNRTVKTQMSMRLQRKLLHNDTLKVPEMLTNYVLLKTITEPKGVNPMQIRSTFLQVRNSWKE